MLTGLLILAGGQSVRMGTDKAALPFPARGDPPLIRRVATAVAELAGPPTIAGRHDYGTGWPLVEDEPDLAGPVGGLVAGLTACTSGLVLVLAADLPFVSPRLAKGLVEIALSEPGAQAIVPEREGELEPLFAVYRQDASADLRRVARQLARPGRGPSLRRTVTGIRLRRVTELEWRAWDPTGASFLSCNTPEQLAEAVLMARVDQGGIQ